VFFGRFRRKKIKFAKIVLANQKVTISIEGNERFDIKGWQLVFDNIHVCTIAEPTLINQGELVEVEAKLPDCAIETINLRQPDGRVMVKAKLKCASHVSPGGGKIVWRPCEDNENVFYIDFGSLFGEQ
jgi:hypothetical protein